jgi:glyoxylase-like metal-dependent hydrolase (beta-lactamase superfamily II)
VAEVRVVGDGETVRVGTIAITAHHTPGHTPGSTTWTWRSCEGTRCLDMVYADSLNPVSSPGFRFSQDPARVEAFRASIAKVRALPCDVLLAVHPGFADLDGKLRRRQDGAQPDPFIDPDACRAYADAASASLARRLQEEASTVARSGVPVAASLPRGGHMRPTSGRDGAGIPRRAASSQPLTGRTLRVPSPDLRGHHISRRPGLCW